MNLKSVLLGFLTSRDLTGYELKHLMERSVGHFFGASYGSIYPALRDLEEAGLVRSRRRSASWRGARRRRQRRGKEERREFRVSPGGRRPADTHADGGFRGSEHP